MDPRYDPHTGSHTTAVAPWSPQPGAYGTAPAEGGAGDAVVRVGSWIVTLVAATLLAAVALIAGGVLYAVATWRRWPWWPLALTGVFLLTAVALGGLGEALHRHLLALRELTEPGRPPIGTLVAARWPAWLVAQLPQALPLGALLAAVGRRWSSHPVEGTMGS